MTHTIREADHALRTLTRITLGSITAAAIAGGVIIGTAGGASATIINDPTVKIGQRCPATYAKGVIVRDRYILTRDTATACTYERYSYGLSTGTSHTFSKTR